MLLGLETDSQIFGKPLFSSKPADISAERIQEVLQQMLGPQEQLPPMVSAVKHQGKRLYELARQGKTVSRKPRNIVVEALNVGPIQLESYPRALFEVTVSKGTYIRTLCAEIGTRLGGACMAFLVLGCGPFAIADSWTLEEIKRHCSRDFFPAVPAGT